MFFFSLMLIVEPKIVSFKQKMAVKSMISHADYNFPLFDRG